VWLITGPVPAFWAISIVTGKFGGTDLPAVPLKIWPTNAPGSPTAGLEVDGVADPVVVEDEGVEAGAGVVAELS
jgi:hypothetical protein